jgi:hypothetical protein
MATWNENRLLVCTRIFKGNEYEEKGFLLTKPQAYSARSANYNFVIYSRKIKTIRVHHQFANRKFHVSK